MLDKFLSKINGSSSTNSSTNTSVSQKVEDYNKKVIEEQKKIQPKNINLDIQLPERYIDNSFNKFQNISRGPSQKFNKAGKYPPKFSRPNTYQFPQQRNFDNNFQKPQYQREQRPAFQQREYIDDGSYFCSYAVGGNTLVCYKNKEKVEFLLEGISHPDKNNYLAKRANYFLNDLVKKQKVYIEPTETGSYIAFLDAQKQNCINTILINEGYHNSEPYNAESKDKKTSFGKYKASKDNQTSENNEDIDSSEAPVIKEKKNYAYGLFATDHNTFEALFNKEKMTLKIDNLDNISKDNKKICKSMIYDFVSKKSIILKFLKEENGIHYVEVYNKDGECLNKLIEEKHFPIVQEEKTETKSEVTEKIKDISSEENEQCSENDWDWVDSENNGAEVEVPEVTSLPAMFRTPITSKANSPFKKKSQTPDTETANTKSNNNEESFGEEVEVPEVTNLPAMFKIPLSSKPDSPFKKKSPITDTEKATIKSSNNEESFGEEVEVPEITNLPAMFKTPVASKPDSPFKKRNENTNTTVVDSNFINNKEEQNTVIPKKKLSFGKR